MSMTMGDHTPADELERQAWAWLRRLNSGDVKTTDAEAFKRWLNTSPAHKAVFSAARLEWEKIRPAAGSVLRSNPAAAARHEKALHGPDRGRRVFLGAAVGATAAAGVAMFHPPMGLWPAPAQWRADDRTQIGEQRTLALAQRVQVVLNTQTSVRREVVDGQTTGIDLIAGEAAVDLFSAGTPFTVFAGAGRSVAQSGRFEVRFIDGKVCVTCIEGEVRVDHPAGVRSLHQHQQTIYDTASVSHPMNIPAAHLSAWRKGELVFRETPLGQVLDEINRYRPGRVVLMNDAVRSRPVSGSFAINLLDVALAQLQHTFDLRARALPAGLYVLS